MNHPDLPGHDVFDPDDPERDRFIQRIAQPLRRDERLDITFEARVMSAIQAEAWAGNTPRPRARRPVWDWWLRPRRLRLSPLRGLAAAALLVGLTLLASRAVQWIGRSDRTPTASTIDTIHVVRFVLVDPDAHAVSLVGSFNAWQKGATRLEAGPGGAWVVSLPLTAGRHEYAFIVQDSTGEHWVVDPLAARAHDEFDTESSIILLGRARTEQGQRSTS